MVIIVITEVLVEGKLRFGDMKTVMCAQCVNDGIWKLYLDYLIQPWLACNE